MFGIASTLQSMSFDPRSWEGRHYVTAVGVLGMLVLPLLLGPFTLLVFISMFYFVIFVISWDIVSGYTGQFSFGHTFIFAIGGYVSAIMNLEFGLDPALAIPIGTLSAVAAGLVFGAPALRLKGPYFAILTFLLPAILQDLFILFSGTFGGSQGLSPPDELLTGSGLEETIMLNYYLGMGVFLAIAVVVFLVVRSQIGSIFQAIKMDEAVVSNSGYDPAKYKILAFALSSAVGGFGAALYVHTPVGGPTPSQLLALAINIEIIFAAIIGGIGSIGGAVVGGMTFYLLRYYISSSSYVLPIADLPIAEYDFVLFSLAILVIFYKFPDGLVAWAVRNGERLFPDLRTR